MSSKNEAFAKEIFNTRLIDEKKEEEKSETMMYDPLKNEIIPNVSTQIFSIFCIF